MAQTAAPERSNPSFVRYNYGRPAPTPEPADPGVNTPERSLTVATDELLSVVEQAVARIEQGEGTALREIWTALHELQAMVARDPGISMAAEDLYGAAEALVAGHGAGSKQVDVRRWRLLKDADRRLRDRLASARSSGKARHADHN
jgi:hypothetical protein